MTSRNLIDVYIHGSFATTSTWKRIIAGLPNSDHSICVKLPGHGGAEDPDDFNYPTFEPEINAVKKALGEHLGSPIHLIGHSFGGVVALACVLSGQFNINQLTLFEPVAAGTLDNMSDIESFVQTYRQAVQQKEPHACKRLIDYWGGVGSFDVLPSHIKDWMDQHTTLNLRHWDLCLNFQPSTTSLNRIQCPTLIACGSLSNNAAHQIAHSLLADIPDSRFFEIPGASHFMVNTHVNECIELLSESL